MIEKTKKFFALIDANGVGDNWKMVDIENVRCYFEECFGITPLPFPQIDESQKKFREIIMNSAIYRRKEKENVAQSTPSKD